MRSDRLDCGCILHYCPSHSENKYHISSFKSNQKCTVSVSCLWAVVISSIASMLSSWHSGPARSHLVGACLVTGQLGSAGGQATASPSHPAYSPHSTHNTGYIQQKIRRYTTYYFIGTQNKKCTYVQSVPYIAHINKKRLIIPAYNI